MRERKTLLAACVWDSLLRYGQSPRHGHCLCLALHIRHARALSAPCVLFRVGPLPSLSVLFAGSQFLHGPEAPTRRRRRGRWLEREREPMDREKQACLDWLTSQRRACKESCATNGGWLAGWLADWDGVVAAAGGRRPRVPYRFLCVGVLARYGAAAVFFAGAWAKVPGVLPCLSLTPRGSTQTKIDHGEQRSGGGGGTTDGGGGGVRI